MFQYKAGAHGASAEGVLKGSVLGADRELRRAVPAVAAVHQDRLLPLRDRQGLRWRADYHAFGLIGNALSKKIISIQALKSNPDKSKRMVLSACPQW